MTWPELTSWAGLLSLLWRFLQVVYAYITKMVGMEFLLVVTGIYAAVVTAKLFLNMKDKEHPNKQAPTDPPPPHTITNAEKLACIRRRPIDEKKMLVGKHKGRSFQEILDEDPEYALWCVRQRRRSNLNDRMMEFVAYVLLKYTEEELAEIVQVLRLEN